MIVEVCANSVQSALNAQQSGADRLEICSELGIGGITPSYGMLLQMKEEISIPIHVLIRPRSGDFTYSAFEFKTMLDDIDTCVKLGFDGIVSGVLNEEATVDIHRTRLLLKASAGLQFTFHRAFDKVSNPMRALEELEAIGVNNILTSGQQATARAGMPLLKNLLEQVKNCEIIPAAGIRVREAAELKREGFSAIHLSGVVQQSTQAKLLGPSMNTLNLLEEDKIAITDPQLISEVVKTVK